MDFNIKTNWKVVFNELLKDGEFVQLLNKVEHLYSTTKAYPKKEDIFKCFNYFNIEDTKVVIIGQDPYHNPDQANGLAFSVNDGVKTPKSLVNIFKELNNDLGIKRTNANLEDWAKQGVLLLNSSLTVELNKPQSHLYLNWAKYTDYIISYLSTHVKHVVYILWGNNAINKVNIIDTNINCIIKSSHPSPLSAHVSFFNSHPFSKANDYLKKHNRKPIKW
ncbi:MAG: uracil-DNA glycosylase [Malacoplasma sp.]|nr:uracil-DNA glycosylase [Malacoplasma sp.]